LEAINAGDAHALSLAPLVQELNLFRWRHSDRRSYHWEPMGLVEPFEKIINSASAFRNLTKLRMEECVISPAIMEQLGKFLQLHSLCALYCQVPQDEGYGDKISYASGALANLQSLHTLECDHNCNGLKRDLACISMKNLRILKSGDLEVIKALLATDPPVQLKELWLFSKRFKNIEDCSLQWNYLARMTSLTHLSLPDLRLPDGITPSLHFHELQYLHIHVTSAPCFADQPMKEMKISTRQSGPLRALVEVVRHYWQGIVFRHVEYLETDRFFEMNFIPFEFWREFLLNVKKLR